MLRKLIGLVGVAAAVAVLASPAVSQDSSSCCTTSYVQEGKHLVRKVGCEEQFQMPTTTMVRVPAGEEQEGDTYAYITEGKRSVRVILREVPIVTPPAKEGHECSYRYRPVGKSSVREQFCIVNGVEQKCPGMNEKGECTAKK